MELTGVNPVKDFFYPSVEAVLFRPLIKSQGSLTWTTCFSRAGLGQNRFENWRIKRYWV